MAKVEKSENLQREPGYVANEIREAAVKVHGDEIAVDETEKQGDVLEGTTVAQSSTFDLMGSHNDDNGSTSTSSSHDGDDDGVAITNSNDGLDEVPYWLWPRAFLFDSYFYLFLMSFYFPSFHLAYTPGFGGVEPVKHFHKAISCKATI